MKLHLLLLIVLILPFLQLTSYAEASHNLQHDIIIELIPSANKLIATDKITLNSKSVTLTLLNDLQIEKVVDGSGKSIDYKTEKSENYSDITITGADECIIHYSGSVYYQPGETSLKVTHAHSLGMISEKDGEGIYLSAGSFYPYNGELADYKVEVTFPANLEVITSGKVLSEKVNGENKTKVFRSELATDNLSLVGGKYIKVETEYKGVHFRIYTFAESKSSESYLKSMTEYYDIYTELFGDYPYSSFDVVENFFATGFGMPNYTLITGMLMKMPWVFLAPGSLAHEFVHNWWGNSVYVAEGDGNWCEALTTFSSNYYYNVVTGNAAKELEWRKKALIDIEALPEEMNYPVKDFVTQRHTDDAVVGYSKGAFIFYELYKLYGKDNFFAAIKQFAQDFKGKRAGWKDIKSIFAATAKANNLDLDVNKIFAQWLEKTERPTLKLEVLSHNGNKLDVSIKQDLDFILSVPLVITTDKGETQKDIVISSKDNKFSIELDGKLQKVSLDPNYQVLRHLNNFEIPYTLQSTLNNNPLVIIPDEGKPTHKVSKEFIELLNQSGYKCESITASQVAKSDWKNRPIVILSSQADNSFYSEFSRKYPSGLNLENDMLKAEDKELPLAGNLMLMNLTHPANKSLPASIIAFDNLESTDQLKRLFHYMSYSMLMISQTKRGMPLHSQEIFPEAPVNNDIRFEAK
jgi:hypothetical protein